MPYAREQIWPSNVRNYQESRSINHERIWGNRSPSDFFHRAHCQLAEGVNIGHPECINGGRDTTADGLDTVATDPLRTDM